MLDVCAAPGGKSFAAGHGAAGIGARSLSCDLHPHKLKLIEAAARQRLGITSIRTALADAREEHAAVAGAARMW